MRIVVLDSLRGLFAVAIVLLHAPFQGHLHYNPFIRNSDVFVDFFFVLSGFVITMAYREHVRNGRSLAAFLIRRIGRLWPLHASVLALLLLIVGAKIVADRVGVFSADLPYTVPEIERFALESVFLVQAFRNETVFWLNFPSWSISVELWAYVAFGVLCLAPRLFPFAAVALMLFSAAVLQGAVDPGFGHFFGDGLYRGLAFFFLGHFTYLAWRRLMHRSVPVPSGIEIALVVAVVWLVAYGEGLVRAYLLPLTFAVTILVFAFEAGLVSRVLKSPPFVTLGTLSYSVYMIHILVFTVFGLGLRAVERAMAWDLHSPDKRNPNANDLVDLGPAIVNDLMMVGLAAAVVACAFVTYRWVELPGQRVARTFARALEARPVIER